MVKDEKEIRKGYREDKTVEFGSEVTLARLALTRVSSLCVGLTQGTAPEILLQEEREFTLPLNILYKTH